MPPHQEATEWNTKYKLNFMGLRDDEFHKKKEPNEKRILFLGDSCTFGTQDWIESSQTYPKIAEKYLKQRMFLTKIRAINGGMPGYSSLQGYHFFNSLIKDCSPDIVTICYGWNDHWLDIFSDKQKLFLNHVDYYLNKSLSFYLLKRIIKGNGNFIRPMRYSKLWEIVKKKDTVRVNQQAYRKNLKKIIELCRSKGIKVVLLTSPSNLAAAMPGRGWFKSQPFSSLELHSVYNRITREVSRMEQVPIIDLDIAFEKLNNEKGLFADFAHFTEQGHKVAGRIIAEFLYKEKLILQQGYSEKGV